MNWASLDNPHPAAIMQGAPWNPDAPGYTAICLQTHEVGFSGPDELFILNKVRVWTNSNCSIDNAMIKTALHILSCNCGWSHEV